MQPGALNSTHPSIMLLGASIRAMASSAARAGFATIGADLFADRDTADFADVTQIANYPLGLESFSQQQQPMQWAYTGGMENFPEIVERLSASQPLLGCDAATLRCVRCPDRLGDWSEAAGIRATSRMSTQHARRWVAKPERGAGGLGVRFVRSDEELRRGERREAWVPGRPGSATLLSCQRRTWLIGATWQWSGNGRLPFVYAGSWGPARLTEEHFACLRRFADQVNADAPVTGLWGVDWVLDDGGELHVLEINPRWTASMEVLEDAARAVDSSLPSLFWLHAAACDGGRLGVQDELARMAEQYAETLARVGHAVGKRILYSQGDLTVSAADGWRSERRCGDAKWRLADVPKACARVSKGEPLCTILATAPDGERLWEAFAIAAEKTPSILQAS